MLIESVVIGSLMTTAYRSVPNQTDASPFVTATGDHVHGYGIAVSQDMLCPGSLLRNAKIRRHRRETCHLKTKIHYGDIMHVEGVGFKVVNDCMNRRHKRRVDVWVPTYAAEKALKPSKRYVRQVVAH